MLDKTWFPHPMPTLNPTPARGTTTARPRRWKKPRHRLNFLNIRFLQSSPGATRKGL
jgi:hypothetical protein